MPGEVELGAEIAGHRVESIIGRGGMGVVYLAEHRRLGRKVALKVLNPELSENEQFRERFVRESQLAATLDHPNVITIYDAGEVGDVLYISMRYVEGGDLGKLLRTESRLEPERALVIMSQVASALDTAHTQGLVHRDVKPANVLLDHRVQSGRPDRVFLSDFGITKRLQGGGGTVTKSGQFVGTIHYMAPEQIKGRPVDSRVDVYSLGCMLFQCLAGEVPFPRDNEVAVMYAHLQDPPPVLSRKRPELPAELDAVIGRAMAKAPDRRFGTAPELMEAAVAAMPELDLGALTATRTSERVVTLPPAGTRRRRVAGVAAALLAVAAGITALLIALNRGQPAPAKSPSPPAVLGIAWTRISDDAALGGEGAQAITRIKPFGDEIIAVGYDGSGGDLEPAVWRSAGEGKWAPAGLPPGGPGDQVITGITQWKDGLIAAGYSEAPGGDRNAAVWMSPDGRFWRRMRKSPPLGGPGDQSIFRVMSSSQLIAVGSDDRDSSGDVDAAVWTSRDGRDWQLETIPAPGSQTILSVITFGEDVVAVGNDISPDSDPAAWVLHRGKWRRTSLRALHAPGDQQMNSVTTGGPGLIAVGWDEAGGDRDAAVWTSVDGRTWKRLSPGASVFGGAGDQEMLGLGPVNPGLVAVGYDASGADRNVMVWTSVDGRRWEREVQPSLGGPGDQVAVSLLPGRSPGPFLVGFEQVDGDMNAAVWRGRVST